MGKFSQSHGLQKHERTDTDEKPYSCTHCDMKFSQSINMKIHVKRVHTESKAGGVLKEIKEDFSPLLEIKIEPPEIESDPLDMNSEAWEIQCEPLEIKSEPLQNKHSL